jgi:hypothetical protein
LSWKHEEEKKRKKEKKRGIEAPFIIEKTQNYDRFTALAANEKVKKK